MGNIEANRVSHRPDLAVFAATSGHSGVDTVIQNLLTEFARRGIKSDLLRIRNHGPYPADVPANCRIVDLSAGHVETALLQLVRYLRRERPRVLLSDKDSANRVALIASGLSRRHLRCVVRLGTTVSFNLEKKRYWQALLQRTSIRYLYRFADSVIVPSHGAANDLAKLMRADPSRVTVAPNPIIHSSIYEKAQETAPALWPWSDGCPVVVAVGSLTPRKDYVTLVRAFALLRSRRRAHLVIVGEGKDRRRIEDEIASLGIRDDVYLAGYTSNPYPYMAKADVFAHTSRWEGLGIVLVEALALGTPVVATDCPSGPSEILQCGAHGILVPIGDEAAMSAGLAQQLDQPRFPSDLQAAIGNYDVSNSASEYLKILFG